MSRSVLPMEHSDYVVWGWPWQILGAILAEARAGQRGEIMFFCQVNNARLCGFPVGQISQNLHTTPQSVRRWILSENNFENFFCKGSFKKKQKVGTFFQVLRLQAVISPQWLQIDENSLPNGYLSGARCKRFAYGPADVTATPSSLAPIKSRMVYLSGAGLSRLSWKKAVKWM